MAATKSSSTGPTIDSSHDQSWERGSKINISPCRRMRTSSVSNRNSFGSLIACDLPDQKTFAVSKATSQSSPRYIKSILHDANCCKTKKGSPLAVKIAPCRLPARLSRQSRPGLAYVSSQRNHGYCAAIGAWRARRCETTHYPGCWPTLLSTPDSQLSRTRTPFFADLPAFPPYRHETVRSQT